ncbi:hypothetical protein T484DRAFT_1882361 [Baffinella frigidus]|nr:hypothetical protein T484DRAFT_1882361 [Cryptophyta sp. CCMP2293]
MSLGSPWLERFDQPVSLILAQTARAARSASEEGGTTPVGALTLALSLDPPIQRDAFFLHTMAEVPAPATWPAGQHTYMRLQFAPLSVQRAVAAAFAIEAPRLSAATRTKCMGAVRRRASDAVTIAMLERAGLFPPAAPDVHGPEADTRCAAFALHGTSLLADFARTRPLVGVNPAPPIAQQPQHLPQEQQEHGVSEAHAAASGASGRGADSGAGGRAFSC